MRFSDLLTEKDSDRLSKGAIMMWITFFVAMSFIVHAMLTNVDKDLPGGLLTLLTTLLGYNFLRRGADTAAETMQKVKSFMIPPKKS